MDKCVTLLGLRTLLRRLKSKYPLLGCAKKISSHDLKNLFQGVGDFLGVNDFKGKRLANMPEYCDCFENRFADVAVTYTWTTDLEEQLPSFLILVQGGSQGLTFWIDILFNDQNSKDITKELDQAERVYMNAQFHAVILSNGPLRRGYCLLEILLRAKAVEEKGISPSLYVALHSSTEPIDHVAKEHNWYKWMTTFSAKDRQCIQERILRIAGSVQVFNALVKESSKKALKEAAERPSPGMENMKLVGTVDEMFARYLACAPSIRSPWPEEMTFLNNGTGTCSSCQRGFDQHVEPRGSSAEARCFYPDADPDGGGGVPGLETLVAKLSLPPFRLACRAGHPLQGFRTPSPQFGCDVCGGVQGQGAAMWGCRMCNWDACSACSESLRRCHKGHSLSRIMAPAGFGCDECRQVLQGQAVMWGCRVCNWDVCAQCLR